jgi:hypothetical protein
MSEENIKPLNFNEALNILDTASKESFLTEAWIPSLKRNVKLKEINAKQQKSLIESAIDSVVAKSTFSKIFFEIVSANCLEEKPVIDAFTVADKASIAFAIRSQISDKINVVFQENPKIENKIILNDIITKFQCYTHPETETIDFSKNDVTIHAEVGLPTFAQEAKFDLFIYGKEKTDNQVEEIKNIITGAFLGETAKYIKEVKVNDTLLNYNNLQIQQKISFVEKLPAALVQNILEKIVSYKEALNLVQTVTQDEFKKVIEVDTSLFLTN